MCDRHYQKLVKRCGFRARLEPKPERIGHEVFPFQYSRHLDLFDHAQLHVWRESFDEAKCGYSVCRLLLDINDGLEELPLAKVVVKIHDSICVGENLQLA